MLILLSPSKTLDFASPLPTPRYSTPAFLNNSSELIAELRKKSQADIMELMGISDKLAALNTARYRDFCLPFTPQNARPALLAFKGDVYEGIPTEAYSEEDFTFAQKHLRILSGLYGLLKPLDLIQPYRLEMGTRLATHHGKDLYQFWGSCLTDALNADLRAQNSNNVINLASQEYAGAVQKQAINGSVIDVVFKEKQGNQLKIIGLFAKQARGKMAHFIIQNRITHPQDIREFQEAGYCFEAELSSPTQFTFIRVKPPIKKAI